MSNTTIPPENAPNFGAKVREFARIGLGLVPGNRLDAFVRVRDLTDAGLATVRDTFVKTGGGKPIDGPGVAVQPVYVVDLTPPPAPTGFMATAGTTNILFEVDPPLYTQGNGHAKTVIYGANYSGAGPLPTFADAVEITSFLGSVFACPFDPASNLHLWAEWVSVDGGVSPPTGGVNGIVANTNLIDDAKIANLSAGKILAGSISAGQYIQSADYIAGTQGWRIATLGGGGAFLEVRGNAVFGGTIFASAGTIGGSTIGATYMRSTGYALGVQGWNFNSDGTGQIGGFQVANTYIQSGNYVAGTAGWRITAAGAIEAANITLTGGLIRNSANTAVLDLGAAGAALLLRAGTFTNFGPYAGFHYPVEISADGAAFFGRGAVSGGQLKASGTYTIPDAQRPAIIFYDPLAGFVSEPGGG